LSNKFVPYCGSGVWSLANENKINQRDEEFTLLPIESHYAQKNGIPSRRLAKKVGTAPGASLP